MRVALVDAQSAFATGITRYADALERELRAAGWSPERVSLRRRELKVGRRRVGGFASLWLSRLAPPRGFDLVHALDPAVATARTDVVTVHDILPEQFPQWLQRDAAARIDWRLSRRYVRKARFVVADSEATRQELLRRWRLDADRVSVAHLGVDTATFRRAPGASDHLAQDRPNLVYVGDDNPRKNLLLAVRAVALLPEPRPRLLRIGPVRFPDAHAAFVEEARRLGVDLVEPGFLRDAEIVAVLSAADAFLWPTLGEGFGLPPLEAMACGAPIVATDLPVNREVLGDHACYHDAQPAAMAAAIARTLGSPPDAAKAIAWARSFTWARCARETIEVYERASRR